MGYRSPQLFGNHNPASDGILPLLHGFFVGFSMCSATRKFRHSDYVSVIFYAPLNMHRIVIMLLTHLASPWLYEDIRNHAVFNTLGSGIGRPHARFASIQLSIASCPCRTASSYVLPCVIHPGSSGTVTT